MPGKLNWAALNHPQFLENILYRNDLGNAELGNRTANKKAIRGRLHHSSTSSERRYQQTLWNIDRGVSAQPIGMQQSTFRVPLPGDKVSREQKDTSQANKDLPFVSVALLQAKDSSLVRGTITTEAGTYRFDNVTSGRYLILASSVAYQKQKSGTFELTADLTIPALTLTEAAHTLNEVKVTTQKPLYEQQIDRLVINVQNGITTAGNTALEVLERSPGIQVNRPQSMLLMNGKAGVMVMIDGMQAQNIEKIELITNPQVVVLPPLWQT